MITDSLKLDGVEVTTFITIDFSTVVGFTATGTTTIRMCSGRNGTSDITYDGNTYNYIGFEIGSLSSEINGQVPTPTLSLDKAGLLSLPAFLTLTDQCIGQTGNYFLDPRGAKVTMFRVSNLDVAQQLPIHEYVVSQATKETNSTFEWQLAVSLGIDRANNQSIANLAVNRCNLRYRRWNSATSSFDYTPESEGGCPYGNPTTVSNWTAVPLFGTKYFNSQDAALTFANRNLDRCSYSAKGCQLRFDPDENGLALPFVMLYSPNILGRN